MTIAVAPCGIVGLADLVEHALGLRLDLAVDRELHVAAGLRLRDHVAADLVAERVARHRDLPVGPVQDAVLGGLDTEQALTVGADRANQATADVALRVDAARVGQRADPVETELLDLVRRRSSGTWRATYSKPVLAVSALRMSACLLPLIELRELRSGLVRVRHLIRRREDVGRVLGDREPLPAPVEDAAPGAGHGHGRGLLAE